MIFICHHLHEHLKMEYLIVKDLAFLWRKLKEHYKHQKTVILPQTRYEWMQLRLQDYKSVIEYNSIFYKITSCLLLCGEKITDSDMLEKTFTTFHKDNLILMQQYRERKFEKYYDLLSCQLVVEQKSELILKNHNFHPIGSIAMLEAHATSSQKGRKNRYGKNKNSNGNKNFTGNKNYGRSSRFQSKYKSKAKFNNTQRRNENEKESSVVHQNIFRTSTRRASSKRTKPVQFRLTLSFLKIQLISPLMISPMMIYLTNRHYYLYFFVQTIMALCYFFLF